MLSEFIQKFFGYGSWEAETWFVGMEEGGGDIQLRLQAWDQGGRLELEDLVEFHHRLGVKHHFDEGAILQATWRGLIRMHLVLTNCTRNELIGTQEVRACQRQDWGRRDGKSCLIELLPLPSPDVRAWPYAAYSADMPFLISREAYQNHCAPLRIATIRDRLKQYAPETVIFYGKAYSAYWESVARVAFQRHSALPLEFARSGSTNFYIIKHPTSRGTTNGQLEEIAHFACRQNLDLGK